MSRHRRSERGVALALVAIMLSVFLAFCVVAIELGHLGVSANEVQVVADSAATAATRSLLRNKVSGGNESPATAGARVALENTVDGQAADGSPVAVSVTQGVFNLTTGSFTAGGATPNAVRTVATATVPNVLGGIFGQRTSQVQRNATAAYAGSCAATTALPLALGSCLFSQYLSNQNCSRLPALRDVPDPANDSCWTSLGPNTANTSQASAYLPSACCQGGSCGGGQSAPRLRTGSQINGLSGQDTALLQIIKDCYDKGIRRFVVPVINCGSGQGGNNGNGNGNGNGNNGNGNGNGNNGNGNGNNGNDNGNGNVNTCGQTQVVGFATIMVNSVKTSGANKGMDVTAICSADDPGGAIGCASYGKESVTLVQ